MLISQSVWALGHSIIFLALAISMALTAVGALLAIGVAYF
jgi:hypothetical protein